MSRDFPLAGIILAAGHGKRMRSGLPKMLFPLLGLPLLEYTLQLCETLGCDPICVVVGAGAQQIEARFAHRRILWALQNPPRGTGDATLVGLCALSAAAPSGQVVVVNGDLPLLKSHTVSAMVAAHRAGGAAMTILTQRRSEPTGYGRIIRDDRGEITKIVEEADATPAEKRIAEVNGGVYVAERTELAAALSALAKEAPPNSQGEFYLPPVAGAIRRRGRPVQAFELTTDAAGELAQVNTRADLVAAGAIRRAEILEGYLASGVTVVDPASTYIESSVDIGAETVIHPFCVIEAGVRIGRHCQVGPFAHLRSGTVMADESEIGNFTEAKNTRLGAGSKAKHLSYLGDGEIGAGVNIGAGTIFANFDGEKKHGTRVGDGASLGSGTILVAPVEVGPRARTGAGAVVPRGKNIPAGETHVGIPARKALTRDERDGSAGKGGAAQRETSGGS